MYSCYGRHLFARRRHCRRAAVVVAALLLCSGADVLAMDPAGEIAERAPRLIRELDDDAFEVRRRAQRELIAIGASILPWVQEAQRSGSAEVRARAREIAFQIEHEQLNREFRRLSAARSDDSIDLEAGLVLVAQVIDPSVRREPITAALDALADRVRKKLPVAPRDADPRQAVDAMRQVLFVEEGFDGNRRDYENPANSSLAAVLATKQGLPILLSQVVLAVGRRLDLPLVGFALPGRFMVRYDDPRAVTAAASLELVVDPFESGKLLTLDDLADYLPDSSDGGDAIRRLLEPATKRQTLVRVLNNLSAAYANKQDYRRSTAVDEYRDIIAAGEPAAGEDGAN